MTDLVVVADTHLTRRDGELEGFVDFLRRRGSLAGTVAHLGDLFNVWLGRPRFEMEHMRPVLDAFRALRRKGVRTILAEGNRDFHVRRWYRGDAFDEVAEEAMDVTVGSRRVRLAHGDLVNEGDRQYRAWRRFSKSTPVWIAMGALPARAGVGLAETLEARLRGTNVRHKISFPRDAARRYAASAFRSGCDLLLLGHFHEERAIARESGGGEAGQGEAEVVVLPDWRSSHRYLHVSPDGAWRFEAWPVST